MMLKKNLSNILSKGVNPVFVMSYMQLSMTQTSKQVRANFTIFGNKAQKICLVPKSIKWMKEVATLLHQF